MTIIIRCSGSACAPNTRLVFSSHDRRLRSTHKRVVLPTRYGPVGLGIGNTGANTPASVETDAPAAPSTATHRHRIFGTHTPLTRPSAFRPVHVTALRYAGTTCHRVPSSLACARMIKRGAPPRRRRRAPAREEEALFSDDEDPARPARDRDSPEGRLSPGRRARAVDGSAWGRRVGIARTVRVAGRARAGAGRGVSARARATVGGPRQRMHDTWTRGRMPFEAGRARVRLQAGHVPTHPSLTAPPRTTAAAPAAAEAARGAPGARAARTKTSAPPALR